MSTITKYVDILGELCLEGVQWYKYVLGKLPKSSNSKT